MPAPRRGQRGRFVSARQHPDAQAAFDDVVIEPDGWEWNVALACGIAILALLGLMAFA